MKVNVLSRSDSRTIVNGFPELFEEVLSTFKWAEATIYVLEETLGNVFQQRSHPFHLRDEVKQEIQQLGRDGIVLKVGTSA